MGCCYSSENEDSDQVRPRQAGFGTVGYDRGTRGPEKARSGWELDCRLTEYGGLEGTDYGEDAKPCSYPLKDPSLTPAWGYAGRRLTRPLPFHFSSTLDREERKLLLDPSSTPTKALNGAEPNYHSLPSARTDEQALLSSILAKTASNIIDVSAADSQGMEQHEYMDRARQYSSLTHWKKLPPLPSLTSQPHQVLASEPIPFSDLQQVSRIAAYAYSALSQIRVDAKEELVVQFGIP
ncbi:RhoA activator C11orf59-like [Cricetulus griseus]|uniref:Ragulator complex protein LAMTOR1 n=1 Tax=Cricetulus griseus TaxID=10029 RepID=G3II19_CRIGR|nr:RhoA activator C11orf59-like [Cricetulus griseus]ERE80848.1 ragulator complex protein LAMTOR1-like protein [Cricetulus griseus]